MANQKNYIIGFIHVCMVNEFFEIFKEQISLIIKYGLYDVSRVINVGCVGSEENKLLIEEYIKAFPKVRIAAYSPDIKQYEYITLRVLKKTADLSPDFYGFYIHSKGVSWPKHEGGKYWRDYMNYYNLQKWELNTRMLDLGYETSGVKMITRGYDHHYSGNFFWFKSKYVRECLRPIEKLDTTNRFQAEFWICSGKPVAATLCQKFIDYSAKGIFNPNEK